jgi:hypothetical protein
MAGLSSRPQAGAWKLEEKDIHRHMNYYEENQ